MPMVDEVDKRRQLVLHRCRSSIAAWSSLDDDAFETTPPRGFSTFTMAVQCSRPSTAPQAAFYRHLDGKENAILTATDERVVYEALAEAGIAAPLLAYEAGYRIEAFYGGRTLTRADLADHDTLRAIAEQLAKLHALDPGPAEPHFFDRLAERWTPLVQKVLQEHRSAFPPHEQAMCDELMELCSNATRERVRMLLPDEPPTFCHNDTYHGNIMRRADGEIRLLDFEFSCRGFVAFDFSNLFAETVMRHGLPDPPHFDIADAEFTRADIDVLVDHYARARGLSLSRARELADQTEAMIPLSDYMYAMAAVPLAVDPVQQIRFIPYAWRRFRRFCDST